MHLCTPVCGCLCEHLCICIYVAVCVCICACECVCACMWSSVSECICPTVSVSVCLAVPARVCVSVSSCVSGWHACLCFCEYLWMKVCLNMCEGGCAVFLFVCSCVGDCFGAYFWICVSVRVWPHLRLFICLRLSVDSCGCMPLDYDACVMVLSCVRV